ncbi:sister chromatid cohesion C-terminus-domain-containing protein [Gongronella butleri]|nr:sister chromatid cohesion C-terminus-domain-containing protein [Gongronella butleri]
MTPNDESRGTYRMQDSSDDSDQDDVPLTQRPAFLKRGRPAPKSPQSLKRRRRALRLLDDSDDDDPMPASPSMLTSPTPTHTQKQVVDGQTAAQSLVSSLTRSIASVDAGFLETNTGLGDVVRQLDALIHCLQTIQRAVQQKRTVAPPATIAGMTACRLWLSNDNGIDLTTLLDAIDAAITVVRQLDILDAHRPYDSNDDRIATLDVIAKTLDMIVKLFDVLATGAIRIKTLPADLVHNGLMFAKLLLDNMIYPLIDSAGQEMADSGDLEPWVQVAQQDRKAERLLGGMLLQLSRVLRRCSVLFSMDEIKEPVLVCMAYICLGAFFHDIAPANVASAIAHCPVIVRIADDQDATEEEGNEQPVHSLEYFKLAAMDKLTLIFSTCASQRQWILDELLHNLDALTVMDYQQLKRYRLRNNNCIHVLTALIMQLIQSCCNMDNATRNTERTWLKRWEQKARTAQNTQVDSTAKKPKSLDQLLAERAHDGWKTRLEAAMKQSAYFLEFMMYKCKSRKSDEFSKAEYRAILEGTVADLLTVLYDPDWPVAELILYGFTTTLAAFIDSDHGDMYLRTCAVDWLGKIVGHIKNSAHRLAGTAVGHADTPEWLFQLARLLPQQMVNHDAISLKVLDTCRMKLYHSLMDEAADSNVLNFYLCSWGFLDGEYAQMLLKDQEAATNDQKEEDEKEKMAKESTDMETDQPVRPDGAAVIPLVHNHANCYWKLTLGVENALNATKINYDFPEMNWQDLRMLSELLASRQLLARRVPYFMSKLLASLEKNATTFRSKALQAISGIIDIEPMLLNDVNLCNRIIKRVNDTSRSVRVDAVKVLAKHLEHQPDVPRPMFVLVTAKVNDTHPSVRKQVIRLLPDLYSKTSSMDLKIDIAIKLLVRINDNEHTIQKLALKGAQHILLQPFRDMDKKFSHATSFHHAPNAVRSQVTQMTSLFIAIVADMRARPSVPKDMLDIFIDRTIRGEDAKNVDAYKKSFKWIIDALFESLLVMDEAANTAQMAHCMTAIHAFAKPCPDLLHETQISALLPYLGVATSDDWTIAQYVMGLYRDVLPRSKRNDVDFAKMVEGALLQVLGKCPAHVIEDAAACLCALVNNVSHRHHLVTKMLASCQNTLRQDQLALKQGQPLAKAARTTKAMLICALLCEHFDFCQTKQDTPAHSETAKESSDKMAVAVIDTLLFFAPNESNDALIDEHIKLTALQALGHVYAAHPTYILAPKSLALLDRAFASDDVVLKTELMRVLDKFLQAEEIRLEKKAIDAGKQLEDKVIDVDTLLGNTEEFAELGVNGSLMQRYMDNILENCLSPASQLRLCAFDVVSAVINQGLAHPVLCMPAIIAAETSPDLALRTKAYYLHLYIHNKFGRILYSQINLTLQAAYAYQKLIQGDAPKGYGKRDGDGDREALLASMFKMVKEDRIKNVREDVLSCLVKAFDVQDQESTDNVDLAYLAFLADNLVALPYSLVDEVLFVLHAIDRLAMTNGGDDWALDDDDMENDDDMNARAERRVAALSTPGARALAILLRVRNTLIDLYGISQRDMDHFNPKKLKDRPAPVVDIEETNWTDLIHHTEQE